MRAMILAAGRGARMKELTATIPKPLITCGGRYLIEYSLLSLVQSGVKEIVINVCYRAELIKQALGNGERYGVKIYYSEESEALETGGGIYQALPLLGPDPFIVLSSDIITDYPLQNLPKELDGLAHLVLVDNPSFHPKGDFCLTGNTIYCGDNSTLTFSNIGLYRPELFAQCKAGNFRLGNLLQEKILAGKVRGEYYQGIWHNIGTQNDLQDVRALSN